MDAPGLPAADTGRRRAILYLLITAVMWSTGGFLIKWIPLHPVALAGARSFISALVLLLYVRKPRFTWSVVQIGAAVAYTATVILFVAATKMTTAANAILLQYTAPVFVALLGAWFLNEKTVWLDWATIAVVAGGMTMFFLDKLSSGGFMGNALAVLSGFSLACLVILLRKQKDASPMESVLLGNILTALIGLPFLLTGPLPGLQGWIGLTLAGVFQLGLPYIIYAIAIRHVTAVDAVLIPVIEPILNPVWVFIAMGEIPGPRALTGGFIVLLAVTLRCLISETRPASRAGGTGQRQPAGDF